MSKNNQDQIKQLCDYLHFQLSDKEQQITLNRIDQLIDMTKVFSTFDISHTATLSCPIIHATTFLREDEPKQQETDQLNNAKNKQGNLVVIKLCDHSS